jgi:disulfide bond formation protein DsbB
MKFIQALSKLSQNKYYWLSYIVGSLSLLAMALYSQYIDQQLPCVMCIQVRLLLSLLILLAVIGLLTRNRCMMNVLSNLSVVLVAGTLVERSYMLLGTERGFVFSDCGFDLGLPSWLQLDVWLPGLYGVETSCGYTPELFFGITMAEALMVMSVSLLVFSASIFILGMIKITPSET